MNRHPQKSHKAQSDFIDYLLSFSDIVPLLDLSLSDDELSPHLLREQGIEIEHAAPISEDELYRHQVENSDRFLIKH